MKLGGSMARRRGKRSGKKGKGGKKKQARPVDGQRERGERLPLLWTALGLALAGWLGGYVVATQLLFPAPAALGDLYEVPDVRGLGLATARERLAGAGLELGPVDSLRHPSVPDALIVGQSPLPGQIAQPRAAVSVTISLGPQIRSIPDVARLAEGEARIVLESSGFLVSIDTAQSEVPRGHVIRTNPPPDSVLPLPAQVRLVVSTGPPLVPMPLVLGLEEAQAVQLLDSLGLEVVAVDEVFRFGRDRGIVVEQEPAANTQLERGTEVRLAVGRRR